VRARTGALPSLSASASTIVEINLSGNRLAGAIPAAYAGMTRLTSLTISNNNNIGGR
jgi:hypothetical protein